MNYDEMIIGVRNLDSDHNLERKRIDAVEMCR